MLFCASVCNHRAIIEFAFELLNYGLLLTASARIQEIEIGEAVNARTQALSSFHSLGPPDLVHLTKVHARTGVKEVSNCFKNDLAVSAQWQSIQLTVLLVQGWDLPLCYRHRPFLCFYCGLYEHTYLCSW